ncbi:MAG: hypothetical protein MJ172_06120 [Clostridia bacterium]|nr:hypothetical protein [Clostridia bacterium]
MKKKFLILPVAILSMGLFAGCDLESLINSDGAEIEQAVQKVASEGYGAIQGVVGDDVLGPIDNLKNSVAGLGNTDIENFSASEVIVFDSGSIDSLLQGMGGLDDASFDVLPDSVKNVLDSVLPGNMTQILEENFGDLEALGIDESMSVDDALSGSLNYFVDGEFEDQSWILNTEDGEDILLNFTNVGDNIVSVTSQYIELPSGDQLQDFLGQFVDVDSLEIIDLDA